MEKIELLNNILGDIGNFVLVIFGFSVTLFTVLYSFILNKREQLKEYSDKIKDGNKDALIFQRHSGALVFISNLKKFNRHLIVTIFIDLVVYLSCMFSKYFLFDENVKETITFMLGISAIIIVCYVSVMLVWTIRDYIKITKI